MNRNLSLILLVIAAMTKLSLSKHHKSSRRATASKSLIMKLKSKQAETLNALQDPRKLMLAKPLITSSDMIGADSSPQVDAPRLLIKNFPKPTDVNYLYPQRNLMNTTANNAPLTVLPARVVDDEDAVAYENASDPTKLLNRFLNKEGPQRKRGLLVSPYMNMGPGFMDIGQSGVSPMGMVMSNPDLPSLSPFLPRASPPPPIRIQMRDPVNEQAMNNTLTQSEQQVSDLKRVQLQKQLVDEIQGLKSDMQNKSKLLIQQFAEIQNTVQNIKQHKIDVETETKALMAEVDKPRVL